MSMAAVLLAAALLAMPPVTAPLRRLDRSVPTHTESAPMTGGPFDEAAACELLAVCLRSGLSTARAVAAVAASASGDLAAALGRVAELLALGTDAPHAWTLGAGGSSLADVSALVRRTSSSGAAFAAGLDELARRRREDAQDAALAEAERAGVRISAPLGLCFLPAFVVVGIAPVVVGLASTVLAGV